MSRKEASNTFGEGLIKDLNPINTPDTALTDCINGTIITYNGNEHSLQNDMGNYGLKYCKLKQNYIPVGVKEYGDIIYIVSYNPLDEHVEIGSYPSPETITDPDDLDNLSQTIPEGSGTNYSDIAKTQDTKVFYGDNPERYKINPGDKYKIVETLPTFKYKELQYFITDENRKTYNITDKVGTGSADEQGFRYVEWDVPGWLSSKVRLAELNDFDINVKRIIVPSYGNSDLKLNLSLQAITSDHLIINSSTITSGTKDLKARLTVTLIKNNGTEVPVKTNLNIDLDQPLNQRNGNYIYHSLDWSDLGTYTASEYKSLIIKAVPVLSGIVYDKLEKVLVFNLNQKGVVSEFNIGSESWWYNVDPKERKFNLMFNTQGLAESSVLDQDVFLYYTLKHIDGTIVEDKNGNQYKNILCTNWNLIGETNLEFEFEEFTETNYTTYPERFYAEDFYIMEFTFYDTDTISQGQTPLREAPIKKVITATQLMNGFEKYKYDEIYFNEWISKYFENITGKTISLSGNANSSSIQYSVPSLDDTYKTWTQPSGIPSYPLFTEFNKYEDSLKKGFTASCDAQCEVDITCKSDIKLPSGPIWIALNSGSKVNFNSSQISKYKDFDEYTGLLTGSITGTITDSAHKKVFYNLTQLSGTIDIWNYSKSKVQTKSFRTVSSGSFKDPFLEGMTSCVWRLAWDRLSNERGNPEFTVSGISSSTTKMIYEQSTQLLAEGSKSEWLNYDMFFVELGVGKLSNSSGGHSWNNHMALRTDTQTEQTAYIWHEPSHEIEYKYFAILQLKDMSQVAVIPIINVEDKEEALAKFDTIKNRITHLVCDPGKTGIFLVANKLQEPYIDSSISFSMNGSVDFGIMSYLDNNLFTESGRNSLIAEFSGINEVKNLKVSSDSANKITKFDSINLDQGEGTIQISVNFDQSSINAKFAELDNKVLSSNIESENEYGAYLDDPILSTYTSESEIFVNLSGQPVNEDVLDILNKKEISNATPLFFEMKHTHLSQGITVRKHLGMINPDITI